MIKYAAVKYFVVITVLITLCACQHSPRKEYFALNAAIAEKNDNQNSTSVEKVVGIGPLSIPEYLQHSRISYWKTPLQLSLLENQYWAEPLEQGISRVLRLHVQAAHPQWRVVQFPWRSNQRPAYSIRVDIQRLDAFRDHAVLEAGIDTIDTQTNKIIASKQFSARVDSSSNSADIARAYSELLQQLANDINKMPSLASK
ncbi:MAG: PqiC family protein [Cellvibrio sp.]|uniref:PqiC family protein n=1 Tax=Cellvibrio sp. TaxID=1965322 RepID=UPI0031A0422E